MNQASKQLNRPASRKLVSNWMRVISGAAVMVLLVALSQCASGGETTPEPVAASTPTNRPTPPSTSTPLSTSTPRLLLELSSANASLHYTWTRPTDGMVMVYVPSGTFQMGSAQEQQTVTVDAFWIDQTEVTNAQYVTFLNDRGNYVGHIGYWLERMNKICLADEKCRIEQVGGEYQPKSNYATHPANNILWYMADAYCKWAGVQLPTRAQWEYAARGTQGYIYPWGNDGLACELAQFAGCPGDTIPVDSLPRGASWCDALGMAGNVWEWTSECYGYYPDGSEVDPSELQRDPKGPFKGDRVLRGGSWNSPPSSLCTFNRYFLYPLNAHDTFGFRCVVQVPE